MRTISLALFLALIAGCTSDVQGVTDDLGGVGGGGGNDSGGGGGDGGGGGGGDLATGNHPDLANPPLGDLGTTPVGGFTMVVTIVLENQDYKEVVGSPNAPYLNSLINNYALATNYKDSLVHPSMPNYLYMISGSVQGQSSDIQASQLTPFTGDNLGNQLQQAHIPWGSYQESMVTACKLSDSGNFGTKHDPFLYFANIQNGPNGLCAKTNVDYSQFAAALAAGATQFMWITPDLIDDGHGGPVPIPFIDDPAKDLTTADTWCKTEVQKIIDSPIFKAGGVIFLTWDEAEARNGDDPDQIPMIIISPKLTKKTSAAAYSHASYLATVEDIFGLPRLGAAVGAPSMMEFFK